VVTNDHNCVKLIYLEDYTNYIGLDLA